MTRENYFCENYLDKIYYYYLKKTGNADEANDLTSEAALEVLKSLSKGINPESFNGWVWAIVKNRYARWANKKHIRLQNEEQSEIDELNIVADELVEEKILYDEQINELRRELTLINKDYREIIIAYYIENNSISDISKKLSIPEGTVKTKLFNGRQRLKEGMQMARTFGKLSYAPEEIEFCQSGGVSTKWEPNIYIYDKFHEKICKNILIEAYRNPVTMQELSIELGIAMPYIEPFVEGMTESTLLIKDGNKAETATYETNFVIVSAESWRKMQDKLASIQDRFVKVAYEYLEKSRELQLEAGNYILGKYQDYEEQKWTLTLRLADDIQWALYDKRNLQFNYDTVRPNKGSWDVMGMQKYDGPRFMWVGHSASIAEYGNVITAFVTEKQSEYDKEKITFNDIAKLINLVLKGEINNLSEREIEELLELNMIRKCDEGYEITFGVYTAEHNSETLRYAVPIETYNKELLHIWNELMSIGEEYMEYCENVMRGEIPNRLMTQFNFCMHSIPFLRGMVVDGMLKNGFLKSEDELSDMIGVYTCI